MISNYSENYINQIRKNHPEFWIKTNDEIVDLLKKNDDRYYYEQEFALKKSDIAIDEKTFDIEKFESRFPWVWNLILDYVNSEDFYREWNLVLHIEYKDEWQKIWSKEVIWHADNADDYKFWSPNWNKLKHDDQTTLLWVLHISNTFKKDNFGRPLYILEPKLIQVPSKKSSTNQLNLIFVKNIDQTQLTEFMQSNT